MVRLSPGAANRLWLLHSQVPWRAFLAASRDPREAQISLLRSILRRNAACEYGRRFELGDVRTVDEYRSRVPLVRYEDLAPDIRSIQRGREGVLTAEPVLLLQPSSGSIAPSKHIPYTSTLRRQFNRAVSVWIGDLFWNRPGLMDGPAYWSLSPIPPGRGEVTEGPRVGFDEDAAYLAGPARMIVADTLAVPEGIGRIRDPGAHRYATLRYLLGEPELRIMSVWSPTFLSLMMEPLSRWWDRLVEEVSDGTLTVPVEGQGHSLNASAPDPGRAAALRSLGPDCLPEIWPSLGLLSAWADGPSEPYGKDLRRTFPGVPFQPKGLVATEAFVTIPRWGLPGAHPAITSHFLEFLPQTGDGRSPPLVDELMEGECYEVVVTTGGGLYRYRTGDLVEVVGTAGGLPCLRFGGRADQVSDRVGEKLSDGFVTWALHEVIGELDLEPDFSLLAPEEAGGGIRYVWYLHPGEGSAPPDPRAAGQRLDEILSANFHYAQCRRLGQLASPEIRLVDGGAPGRYLRAETRDGRRLGDVKIPALETRTGWDEVLRVEAAGSPPASAGRRSGPPGLPEGRA